MKRTSFKQRVDDLKARQKSFEDWQYADGSIAKEKIIDRKLAFLYWDIHSHNFDNNYLLLDFAASVYIF